MILPYFIAIDDRQIIIIAKIYSYIASYAIAIAMKMVKAIWLCTWDHSPPVIVLLEYIGMYFTDNYNY